jgi:hypothetical protein
MDDLVLWDGRLCVGFDGLLGIFVVKSGCMRLRGG